jgi:lipid-A-disaccharide synthase
MGDSNTSRSILFIAGDLSGDAYTSRLAERLAERHPDFILHALGGKQLGHVAERTGGTWVRDTTNCSAIGISSVIRIFFRAGWLQHQMRRFVRSETIDAVVLCDWGGFNCRQLEFFHKAGIPILYYFPPRSWQRTGNAGIQFARLVTRVATPFEWSAARLTAAGCHADWVGHPLLESTQESRNRKSLRQEFGREGDEKLVALFPGSRLAEIRVLAPRMAEVAAILASKLQVKFVVPVPEPLVQMVSAYFPSSVKIIVDRAADALLACDAAIVKTGSATLEAAVAGAPQVAVYDFGWVGRIEWGLLWWWKKIPYVAMPNIILQREVVPELLGMACRTDAIAAAVTELLQNAETRQAMESGYGEIRDHLGEKLSPGATERTVEILEEMLGESAVGEEISTRSSANWLNRTAGIVREAKAAFSSRS